jgi:CBS domain containing-hemolysin-like protein
MGRIPRVGEKREEDGLRFTVEEGDRRRVLRVRVEAIDPARMAPEREAQNA